MCGIVGFNWRDEKLVTTLADLLKHRGPDMEGRFCDERVSLGHRRLSIIDLSDKGRQPMADETKRYRIVYNGEIFNYRELRDELKTLGHTFVSETDTEVVLKLYIEFGPEALVRLDGQFAFCIYDSERQELFLARDRIGILPLYYFFDGARFIFGSELKVILEAGIDKEIDHSALMYYLCYGYTPRNRGLLRHTHKLEPGHYLVFDLVEKRIKFHAPYWQVKLTGEITDEQDAARRIRDTLEQSVKERLLTADVPVGAFLSGGIDSSAIVALASKYQHKLKTFSITFEYPDFDESAYARDISGRFGTEHHEIKFTVEDIKKLIPELVYHYDDPLGDPSIIPTYLVSKVARQHVTVALSGDGGDELFGGYTAYKHYRLVRRQERYPGFVNTMLHRMFKHTGNGIANKPKKFFEIGTLPVGQKFARIMSYLNMNEFKQITGISPEEAYDEYGRHHLPGFYLNSAINTDLHCYLPDDILTKVDRASLANSLETRPPVLDPEMIDLACRIDPRLKLRGQEGKWILKKALTSVLPEEIIYRKKQGFGVPLKYYLAGDLKGLVAEKVVGFTKHDFFNREAVKSLLKAGDGHRDMSRIIWPLLMFNLWWERWME
jgi:asparagine synthase (glutamine-hydrolysing)